MEFPDQSQLVSGLIGYVILAASIALHEWGHAISADRLGDDTPRRQGRVTLNPFAHLDPIGTGLIPLFMILFSPGFVLIGWGRPVMVNIQNFENRRRDHLLSVAAGPGVNFAIAMVTAIIYGILLRFNIDASELCVRIIFINSALMVFNLIPVPPLDGSHFLRYAVGMSEEAFVKMSMYGILGLLLLVNIPYFQALMGFLITALASAFVYVSALLAGLG